LNYTRNPHGFYKSFPVIANRGRSPLTYARDNFT